MYLWRSTLEGTFMVYKKIRINTFFLKSTRVDHKYFSKNKRIDTIHLRTVFKQKRIDTPHQGGLGINP